MSIISDRILQLAQSSTIAMAKKARQLRSEGKDIINLSLGEPSFYTPEVVKTAAKKAIDDNFSFYSPVAGFAELRQAITEKLSRDNALIYEPEQIVVSTGAKQSIANLVMALINPGDEVISPTPFWVSYAQIVQLVEGRFKAIQTTFKDSFKLTPKLLEANISAKTKLLILNNPCNPSGIIYSRDELAEFVNILKKHPQVYVLTDEIYEQIYFDKPPTSLATFAEIEPRVITINGLSKAFAMTGWRLGYLAAHPEIARACEKVQGQFTSGTCAITQQAAIAALQMDPNELTYMREDYKYKRDKITKLLQQIPELKIHVPQGAFYLFPDVSELIGKTINNTPIHSTQDLCLYLLDEANVATVDGSQFGNPECIRLCFAVDETDLMTAGKRIVNALT